MNHPTPHSPRWRNAGNYLKACLCQLCRQCAVTTKKPLLPCRSNQRPASTTLATRQPAALLSTLLSGACMALPASAQEGSDASAASLPAVSVSASAPLNQAFEVNVGGFGAKDTLEVPLAIQSYDAQTLADTAPRTVRDVLAADPSVQTSNYGGGFDNFRLRGFAMDNFNTIRRDGLALAPHYDVPLELVERVDVLKGPSGFLYGFNSPGGTINYIPKRPTQAPLTRLTTQATSLQGAALALDISRTAGQSLGWRLNAGHEKIGNFHHFGDLERRFAGLATDVRLGERALLQLHADWNWKSAMSDPLLRADQSSRADALNPASYIAPPRFDRRNALSPSWYRHKTEAYNLEAKFDYHLNERWTSITQANYSQVERHGGYVDLFDIQPNGDIGYADLYQSRGEIFSTWAVQSYMAGKLTTGSIQHDLFFGASHRQFRDKSPFWDFVESAGNIGVADISVGNIRNPQQPGYWDFGPEQDIDFQSSIKESSIFASNLINLHPQYQVLLGGRTIWYKARNLSADALPQNKNVFVPSAAVMYRPADTLMTYISYSRGFEKGDYAPYNANNANQPTDTIASRQVEIGLKTEIQDNTNIGIALFDIRRDASYLNTANDFVSNGHFIHRGLEINATAYASKQLALHGNFAWLDTELKNVTDPSTLGKRSEGVPRLKSSLGLQYRIAAIPGLSIDANVHYVGARAVDAQNSGFISSYTLWDAGLQYDTQWNQTPVSLRLQGKNLGNKYYYPGVYYSGGLEVGREREIFLSARFSF